MHLMSPMRKVEPKDVNSRIDHLLHDRRITRRRTDCRHNLGPNGSKFFFVHGFHFYVITNAIMKSDEL